MLICARIEVCPGLCLQKHDTHGRVYGSSRRHGTAAKSRPVYTGSDKKFRRRDYGSKTENQDSSEGV